MITQKKLMRQKGRANSMTDNMQYLIDTVTVMINRKYDDELPTLEQINAESDAMRAALNSLYPISDEEFAQVKKTLASNILHTIGVAITLKGTDSAHQSWYLVQENDGFYWDRYRTYLKNIKHWGIKVVNRLNETTNGIMDDLGNPKDHARPFQRRGSCLEMCSLERPQHTRQSAIKPLMQDIE